MAFGLGATIFATTSKQTRQVQAAEGNYYSSINSNETGSTLLNSLHTLVNSGSVSVSYNWSRYEAADEDPNNSNNIITIYARSSLAKTAHVSNNVGWNREHTFPQSKMSSNQAESDNHIIFASDYKINGARSNIKMGVVTSGSTLTDSYGNSTTCRKANSLFDPNNLSRGIVARSTMYAAAMYSYDPTDNFESIATMLNWHLTYQPTSQEINRNDVVYSNQHNRNPFIDHPEYACKIWGDTNDTTRSICGMSSTGVTSISKTSTSIVVGGTDTISAVSSNNGTITWSSSDTDVATVSPTSTASGSSTTITAVAAGTATITASVTISGQTYSKQCSVNVTTSGGGGGQNTGDYTLVTSVSTLSTSDKVVITTENRDSGVTGWNGSKDATVSNSESEWMQYAVSKSGNNVYFKDTSTNTFIAATSSNEFKYTSDGSACTADEFGHFICGGRYLCKNSTYYRLYSSIGSYEPFFIYKVNTTTQKTLSSISVDTAPTKTTYTAGEHFDPTGLKLKLTYSDSSNSYVTYSTSNSSDFAFSPTTSTSLTTSHTSVTISYGGKATTQAITVNAASTTPTVTSVTVSPATLSLDLNGTKTGNLSATVTGTNSPAQTVTWSTNNSGVATVNENGVVTAQGTGTATITATSTVNTSKTGTCTVTVSNSSTSGSSTTVDLSEGTISSNVITWVSEDGHTTITQRQGVGTNSPSSSYIANPRVYWGHILTFTADSGYKIASISITYNSNYRGSSIAIGTSVSDDDIVTDNTTSVFRTLSTAEGGTHVFGSVASSGLQTIYLQNGTSSTGTTQLRFNAIEITYVQTSSSSGALTFAQTFMGAFTCNAQGTSAPTFTTSWAQLKTAFTALSSTDKATLKNAVANESGTDIQKAMARYDYVVAKYKYEDFIDRASGNSANRMNSFSGDSANNLLLVLGSISLLGGLTYLAYFLKKRKED